MHLLDELRAEHDLIDRVLGSLRTWVLTPGVAPGDGARFLRFFRRYAGDFHHAREEQVLFAALAREAELPLDRGPIAALTAEHHHFSSMLDELEPLMVRGIADERMTALATEYSRALWHHIDAENSVLLPESEDRLRTHHVKELPSRPATAEAQLALADGRALVERHAAFVDAEVLRGDGCIMCPSYGEGCRGLEREWWTASEWEEHGDRFSGD